jgi:hypothetical protein
MNKVLIASLDNWDSCSEIPYIFKKAGFIVDVFCGKNFWLKSNNYYDTWIESPNDIDSNINLFLETIGKFNYKIIVITDEPLLKHLNEIIKSDDLFKKIMPITKVNNRNMLCSKIGFSNFCISNDILTPKYAKFESKSDYQNILNTLKFPILNKNEFSWGGTNMCIINSKEELLEIVDNNQNNQPILFQEFIEGEEIRIDAFYYQGELIVYFCAKVLTYAQNRFTYNTRRQYYNNEAIKPYLIDLGIKSGANGFANINYIYENETDNYYLIEMDMRTNSWLAYSQYLSKNNFITSFKDLFNSEKRVDPNAKLHSENIEIGLFYKDL